MARARHFPCACRAQKLQAQKRAAETARDAAAADASRARADNDRLRAENARLAPAEARSAAGADTTTCEHAMLAVPRQLRSIASGQL